MKTNQVEANLQILKQDSNVNDVNSIDKKKNKVSQKKIPNDGISDDSKDSLKRSKITPRKTIVAAAKLLKQQSLEELLNGRRDPKCAFM